MLLIVADTCVPLAIWNVSPHTPMTGVKSDYIYFRVILSINSWHFTLNTAYRRRLCSNKGREWKRDLGRLMKPD